jgi:hypothetical protein
MKKVLSDLWELVKEPLTRILFWGLLIFLIVFIILKTIELSNIAPNIPEILVAIFTLVLAGVTANLARQTALGNKQARLREISDRKRLLLDEIVEWAANVSKSAIGRQRIDTKQLWKTKLEYKIHMTKGTTFIKTVSSYEFRELVEPINIINEKLEVAMNSLGNVISTRERREVSTPFYSSEEIINSEQALEEAVEILLTKAAEISIGHLNTDYYIKVTPKTLQRNNVETNKGSNPWMQGIIVAGFVQLGLFVSATLCASFSLTNQPELNNFLKTNGVISLVAGVVLILIGVIWYFIQKKH